MRILSIYLAPDGEANYWHTGTWSVFVRTGGCAVGCRWCDTRYSWSNRRGRELAPDEILNHVQLASRGATKVTLTGGEPLEQPTEEVNRLLELLVLAGFNVTIETSGAYPVNWLKFFHDKVALVVDWKGPGAGTNLPNLEDNYLSLPPRHVIKYGVATEEDLTAACAHWAGISRDTLARPVISPIQPVKGWRDVEPIPLSRWVRWMELHDAPALGMGLNLQMHKFIYPTDARDEERGGFDWSHLVIARASAAS